MTYDLLIKNGTLVSSEGETSMDIAIQNGKVAALIRPGAAPIKRPTRPARDLGSRRPAT